MRLKIDYLRRKWAEVLGLQNTWRYNLRSPIHHAVISFVKYILWLNWTHKHNLMSVDEDIDARRIARWKFPYEGPPDQVIPTSDASRDLSDLQTYNLGHSMVETYSYSRAWMGVHERAWACTSVQWACMSARERAWSDERACGVRAACTWHDGRAHDTKLRGNSSWNTAYWSLQQDFYI